MIPVSGKGSAAWSVLAEAMRETVPACAADDRYVQEAGALAERELVQMRRTCLGCPLLAERRAFAKVTRPTGGFWAGRHYRPYSRQAARERAEARQVASESSAGGAPGGPGLNGSPRAVSVALPTIETAADGHTADRSNP